MKLINKSLLKLTLDANRYIMRKYYIFLLVSLCVFDHSLKKNLQFEQIIKSGLIEDLEAFKEHLLLLLT